MSQQTDCSWDNRIELGTYVLTLEHEDQVAATFAQATGLAETDPALIDSFLDCARAFYDQHRFGEAEQICKHAVAVSRRHFGSEHLQTARALNDLGDYQALQGDHKNALTNLESALIAKRKIFGDAAEVKSTLQLLSMTLSALGLSAWDDFLLRYQGSETGELDGPIRV